MIVTTDGHQEQPEDLPPSYVSSSTIDSGKKASTTPQACNYISIIRKHHSVKGTFVVDPTMAIPQALLPPMEGSERKNVCLESHYGSVDADIILVDVGKTEQRTSVSVHSKHGSVVARLHAGPERPAIELNAATENGSVAVYLPRSFHGFLTLTTKHGSIVLSDSVSNNVVTFSDIDNTQRCFIGDFSKALAGKDGENKQWAGDELVASSYHGKVKVFYVDEAKTDKPSNFLSRIFHI